MKSLLRCFLFLSLLLVAACGSNEDPHYSLEITVVPEEAGTATPAQGEFEAGRELEISVTPNEHWVFDRWEGDHEGTQNPVVITIDSDKDIAALFVKRDYPLNINIEGEGSVSERIVQEKTTDYPHGTVVELTADPEDGWEFNRWEGDLQGDENPARVTIDGETEVTAVFTRIEYPLVINIEGDGVVLQDSVETNEMSHPEGSVVELIAVPDDNWAFSRWSGDVEGTQDTVQVTIDGPKEVTATFLRTFTLVTVAVPDEGGEITPEGGDFIRDSTFDVTATPNDGWRFVEWRGDHSGTNSTFSLTMNGNKTLEAHFERREYELELNTRGDGRIETFLQSGNQIDTGDDDVFRFDFGSEVELVAIPSSEWSFVRWEGDITGDQNPVVVTMDNDISVTAIFTIFDGGTGEPDDPYQIATLSQLNEIRNHLDSYFIFVDDIDASETSTEGFEPIGDESEGFSGQLDGDGFEISNLTIDNPTGNYLGLFGYIEEDGFIQNLNLVNADISGDDIVGGLAGVNNGTIENVSVSGAVNGSSFLGGLAGLNGGAVLQSVSEVDVSGSDRIGGLAGVNTGVIQHSYAAGDVNGGSSAGGLTGWNNESGEILESYASGNVSGQDRLGGLVGRNEGDASIVQSYALGNVSLSTIFYGRAGGLIGTNTSTGSISEVYATGEVTGVSGDLGGLAGTNSSQVENSYWDTEASGQSNGAGDGSESGMTGLLTAEMTGADAEDNMEFAWDSIWLVNTDPAGYPILWWQQE
jgi:hypothetical protein